MGTKKERMALHFDVAKEDSIVLAEQFLRHEPSYQRMRGRVRLLIPLLFAGLMVYGFYSGKLNTIALLLLVGISLLWFFLYPRYFDRNMRRYARRQMSDASNKKWWGRHKILITPDGLKSKSPSGKAFYDWNSIERIDKTSTHLLLFFEGSLGFAIRIAHIGEEAAHEAFVRICEGMDSVEDSGEEAEKEETKK